MNLMRAPLRSAANSLRLVVPCPTVSRCGLGPPVDRGGRLSTMTYSPCVPVIQGTSSGREKLENGQAAGKHGVSWSRRSVCSPGFPHSLNRGTRHLVLASLGYWIAEAISRLPLRRS